MTTDLKLTKDAWTAIQGATMLGGRGLLVGGFVRDQVLGIESKDIDIEIHGPVDPDALVAWLSKHGKVDTVGQSFGVIKFGQDIDISFPRRDSKSGDGHQGFTIEVDQSMTVEEALSRRDFTINSMALDPLTGELIDPFGGLSDLNTMTIRHTSEEAFAEDPLRVLRAVQFASRFDFQIHSSTARLAIGIFDQFDTLSVERVWAEWEKILTKGRSMHAVSLALVKTGWISHFPEWGVSGQVTDRVIRTVRPEEPKRRATLILGTQFSDRSTEALASFLKRIDAPGWLRKESRLLAAIHAPSGDPAVDARTISRKIWPIPMSDWIACHRLWGAPIDQHEPCVPALLTGSDLQALGWTPGPIFGEVLGEALARQDIEGWTTKEEALEWLSK